MENCPYFPKTVDRDELSAKLHVRASTELAADRCWKLEAKVVGGDLLGGVGWGAGSGDTLLCGVDAAGTLAFNGGLSQGQKKSQG